MSDVVGWQGSYGRLSDEWTALTDALGEDGAQVVAYWTRRFDEMAGQVAGLQAAGRWRSGPRTVLAALGLQRDELKLTAALAWLLQPDGHHGLGDGVLRRLCIKVGSQPSAYSPVAVETEETRADTRADLVVRLPGAVLLVEAKVGAGEQLRQCARLAELWAHEDPSLIFLTPTRRRPETAEDSLGRWHPISWADIAELVDTAAAEAHQPAPGVFDVIATLRGEP